MLGDGSLTRNLIKISLDRQSDKYYIKFVLRLLEELFGVVPTVYRNKRARVIDLIIQRRNLVDFCIKLGLCVGHKIRNNIDIPYWIKHNSGYSIACVRGLVDTDGCFFVHKYRVNKRTYRYIKIAFTNMCPKIIESVSQILIKQGICVRITKDGKDVRIESKNDVDKYIKIVGTNNRKFIDKIIKRRRVRVV